MALVASKRELVHGDGTPCAGEGCVVSVDGGHGAVLAYRVESPSWRTNDPQVWHDDWRDRDRLLLFAGRCVTCGRRTYAFTDGENDPRGVLGDQDIGAVPDDAGWPASHIDWPAAAKALKVDYVAVEVDGVTFWAR